MIVGFMIGLVLLAAPSFGDVLFFGGDRRLDGHVVRKGRDATNVKLLTGSTLTVENHDIQGTKTEPYVAYVVKRGDYYLEERKDPTRALETYQEALRLKPGDQDIQARIDLVVTSERITRCQVGIDQARALNREGKHPEAIALYENLLPTAPKEELTRTITRELAETYAQVAFKYYDHSFFVGAEEMLRKAEALNPNSPTLHFVLGRIHHVNRDWEAADKSYAAAEALDPNIPKLSMYRAEVRQMMQYEGRPIQEE
jgi:tetratricopeptide (TPR) repeat protein